MCAFWLNLKRMNLLWKSASERGYVRVNESQNAAFFTTAFVLSLIWPTPWQRREIGVKLIFDVADVTEPIFNVHFTITNQAIFRCCMSYVITFDIRYLARHHMCYTSFRHSYFVLVFLPWDQALWLIRKQNLSFIGNLKILKKNFE